MVSINGLRKICRQKKLYYTAHAQEQMALRHIRDSEIQELLTGEEAEIIENYTGDKYSPSSLIYGATGKGRILHVQSNYSGVIIAVYEPDLVKLNEDLKTRRL